MFEQLFRYPGVVRLHTNRYDEVDLEMKAKVLAACAIIGNDHRGDASAAAGRKAPDLMAFLASL